MISFNPEDVYYKVGSPELPSQDLIRYALSVDGVSTLIIGIGHVDDDPAKNQLEQNLAAAQFETPLALEIMTNIEEKIVPAAKEKANSYFQRKPMGLTPPRNCWGRGRYINAVTWAHSRACELGYGICWCCTY